MFLPHSPFSFPRLWSVTSTLNSIPFFFSPKQRSHRHDAISFPSQCGCPISTKSDLSFLASNLTRLTSIAGYAWNFGPPFFFFLRIYTDEGTFNSPFLSRRSSEDLLHFSPPLFLFPFPPSSWDRTKTVTPSLLRRPSQRRRYHSPFFFPVAPGPHATKAS